MVNDLIYYNKYIKDLEEELLSLIERTEYIENELDKAREEVIIIEKESKSL